MARRNLARPPGWRRHATSGRLGLAIATVVATLALPAVADAAPPLEIFLERLALEQGIVREAMFERAAIRAEELRRLDRITPEELADLRRAGSSGSLARDVAIFEHLKTQRFEALARGDIVFVERAPVQAAAEAFRRGTARMDRLLAEKVLPAGSLDEISTSHVDRQRIEAVRRMVEAVSPGDHLLVVDVDHALVAAGQIEGRPVYGEIAHDADVTLDDAVTKLSGGRAAPGGRRTLFLDRRASTAFGSSAAAEGRWTVYEGRSDMRPVWKNVYADERVAARLREAGKLRIPRSRRAVLDLVDDPETSKHLRDTMSAYETTRIPPEKFSKEALHRELDRLRGSFVFALAHMEGEYVVVNDVRFRVAELIADARARNVSLLVQGCNAGAHVSGPIGDINSIHALRKIADSLEAGTMQAMFEGLASEKHPLFIDGDLVRDLEHGFVPGQPGEGAVADRLFGASFATDGGMFGVTLHSDSVTLEIVDGAAGVRWTGLVVPASRAAGDAPSGTTGSSVSSGVSGSGSAGARGERGTGPGGAKPDAGGPGSGSGGAGESPPGGHGTPWGAVFGALGVMMGIGGWVFLRRYRHDAG